MEQERNNISEAEKTNQSKHWIPEEIKNVARPKGTSIKRSGNHFYVVRRTSKQVIGKDGKKRIVPVEIGRLGKIENGKYIEMPETKKYGTRAFAEEGGMTYENAEIKNSAMVELAHRFGGEVLEDLKKSYSSGDARLMYGIALLRAAYGNVTDRDLKFRYLTSMASEMDELKGIDLSERSVCEIIEQIGLHPNTQDTFFRTRIDKLVPGAKLAIDGMLKDCNLTTSIFCQWSRKARKKGTKDISILYAFDISSGLPVAMMVFKGNELDQSSYDSFVEKFKDRKDVIVIADKGFDRSKGKSKTSYIIPLKRSSRLAAEAIKSIGGKLGMRDREVLCGKVKIGDRFYYAFRDLDTESKERTSFFQSKRFTMEKFVSRSDSFGTIVFESDLDLDPLTVYRSYEDRWTIETFFNFYKDILERSKVNVQDDGSVSGSEFINFLASLIGIRIKRLFIEKGLDEKYSYKQIRSYLLQVSRIKSKDGKWVQTRQLKYVQDILNQLGL